MATAAAAATGTPATEFSFFEDTKRTERIKIMDIVDKSTKEIYIGNDEDVEEALEREIRCPCLGRKIETKGVVSIAYFKKDDLEKNKGRIDAGTLQLIATIISNEDKLEPDERERIKGAFNGPPLNLMRTLVEVDNALQRRAQTANYQLFQSFTDDDVKDPTFPKYQGISQAPQAPSVKCDVETGKDYPFKPVVRRSRSIEKREPDILVYMYDEDNIMDRPAVVLDKDSAAQMGLPKFVVSSLLLFFPSRFSRFSLAIFQKTKSKRAKGSEHYIDGDFHTNGDCLLHRCAYFFLFCRLFMGCFRVGNRRAETKTRTSTGSSLEGTISFAKGSSLIQEESDVNGHG